MQPFGKIAVVIGLTTVAAFPALAGKPAAAGSEPAQVKWTIDGPVMVASNGMTLYNLTNENLKAEKFTWQCTNVAPAIMNDQQSGVGERPVLGREYVKHCLEKWPAYLADANAQPTGDFGIVDRPGIGRQWTYRNFPLYMSSKDKKPGDRNGLGTGGGFGGNRRGGWTFTMLFMDMPAGTRFARIEEGLALASTMNERPLYTPKAGNRVVMASTGKEDFRPLLAADIASVSGEWTVVEAGPGRRQYAFRGRPLYMAPIDKSEWEIRAAGLWEPVVLSKASGRPADIGKQFTLVGEVYTDKAGRTLYHYSCNVGGGPGGGGRAQGVSCDDPGDSAGYMVALCGDSKQCAERWKPYIAPANAKPQGEWSVVEVTYPMFTEPRGRLYPADAPKVKAWAYRGKPAYVYYDDLKPGDIWGEGTKGLWGSNFNSIGVPGRQAGDE